MKRVTGVMLLGLLLAAVAACTGPEAERDKQGSGQLHYDIGVGSLAENNLSKAIDELRAAVQADPRNARYDYALGNAYLRNQQADQAILAFRKAVELDPRLSDAYDDLGVAYMMQEKWDPAIDAFRKALANPRYLTPDRTYMHLGTLYYIRKQYELADEMFRKLLDIAPQSPDAHFWLGRTFLAQGKLKEAQDELQKAIGIDGMVPIFHLELGAARMRAGNAAGARTSFERVIELSPASVEAAQARRYMQELK